MRVPTDSDNPTYDSTFKVGFMRWLTSSKAERNEWTRRRNAAIPTSRGIRKLDEIQGGLQAKADELDQKIEERQRREQERKNAR